MTALPRTVQVTQLMQHCDPVLRSRVVAIVAGLESELNETTITLQAVRVGRNLVLQANEEMVGEVEALRAQIGVV